MTQSTAAPSLPAATTAASASHRLIDLMAEIHAADAAEGPDRAHELADLVWRVFGDLTEVTFSQLEMFARYEEIVAASQAALLLRRDGAPDPCSHLTHVLARRGLLPPAGGTVGQVLAAPHPTGVSG